MLCDARQEVPQVSFGVDTVQLRRSDQAVERCGTLPTAVRSSEQVVLPPKSHGTQRSFGSVVVDLQPSIMAVAHQRFPSSKSVTNRRGCIRFLRKRQLKNV